MYDLFFFPPTPHIMPGLAFVVVDDVFFFLVLAERGRWWDSQLPRPSRDHLWAVGPGPWPGVRGQAGGGEEQQAWTACLPERHHKWVYTFTLAYQSFVLDLLEWFHSSRRYSVCNSFSNLLSGLHSWKGAWHHIRNTLLYICMAECYSLLFFTPILVFFHPPVLFWVCAVKKWETKEIQEVEKIATIFCAWFISKNWCIKKKQDGEGQNANSRLQNDHKPMVDVAAATSIIFIVYVCNASLTRCDNVKNKTCL